MFKILIIHKPSLGSREVPHKIWAQSVKPFSEAQLGGAAGRAPSPSTWEGGTRPTPAEWKERKNSENQYHRNKKTNRVIVEILLYYS